MGPLLACQHWVAPNGSSQLQQYTGNWLLGHLLLRGIGVRVVAMQQQQQPTDDIHAVFKTNVTTCTMCAVCRETLLRPGAFDRAVVTLAVMWWPNL